MPSGQQNRVPYALTVLPPFVLAAMFPDLFFKVRLKNLDFLRIDALLGCLRKMCKILTV